MNLKKKISENWLTYIIVLAFAVFTIEYWDKMCQIVDYLLTLLSPFIMGGCIAFVINLPMKFIENKLFVNRHTGKRRKGGRTFSILLTIFFLIGIIATALFIIIPELFSTTGELVSTITLFSKKQEKILTDLWKQYPQWQGFIERIDIDWKVILEKIWEFLKSGVGGIVDSTIGVIGSIIFQVTNFLIGSVFAIYLLYSKEVIASQGKQILYGCMKRERVERILYVLSITHESFSNFISGQCIEALILGFMFFSTMLIIGLPYPLLIGVIITVTAVVPVFGSFLGLGIGIFLILATKPVDVLVFIVLFFILQQIEENLIYPHVVGNSVGLPSIWVMVAVTLGGSLMGIIGMLLFLPLASVMYRLIKEKIKEKTRLKD